MCYLINAGFAKVLKPCVPLQWLQPKVFPHKLGIMDCFFRSHLARHRTTWVNLNNGIRWKLDMMDSCHRWIVYGDYESVFFHRWLKEHIPKNGVIIDSGANIGQFVIFFAPLVPNGMVVAVEPVDFALEWLRECLKANSFLNVDVVQGALGEKKEMAGIEIIGCTAGNSRIKTGDSTQSVVVYPLVELCHDKKIRYIDLWKLDVEGYELQALKGAEPLLRSQSVGALWMEMHNGHGESRALCRHLQELGYRCYLFDSYGNLRESTADKLPPFSYGLYLPANKIQHDNVVRGVVTD